MGEIPLAWEEGVRTGAQLPRKHVC